MQPLRTKLNQTTFLQNKNHATVDDDQDDQDDQMYQIHQIHQIYKL